MTINLEEIRKDFPILTKLNRGKPLAYLDNAASSQKPNCVIEKLTNYYREQKFKCTPGSLCLGGGCRN